MWRSGENETRSWQRPGLIIPWQIFGFYPEDSEALKKDLQQGSDLVRCVSGNLTHLLGKEETRDWLRGKWNSPDEMLRASAQAWPWGWKECRFERDSGSEALGLDDSLQPGVKMEKGQ